MAIAPIDPQNPSRVAPASCWNSPNDVHSRTQAGPALLSVVVVACSPSANRAISGANAVTVGWSCADPSATATPSESVAIRAALPGATERQAIGSVVPSAAKTAIPAGSGGPSATTSTSASPASNTASTASNRAGMARGNRRAVSELAITSTVTADARAADPLETYLSVATRPRDRERN